MHFSEACERRRPSHARRRVTFLGGVPLATARGPSREISTRRGRTREERPRRPSRRRRSITSRRDSPDLFLALNAATPLTSHFDRERTTRLTRTYGNNRVPSRTVALCARNEEEPRAVARSETYRSYARDWPAVRGAPRDWPEPRAQRRLARARLCTTFA